MPPEAEVVSGHHQCVLRELVFARGHVLWHVLPRDYVVLHEDKQAMSRVVRVCRDPTLRYVLAQGHRHSMAYAYDLLAGATEISKQERPGVDNIL